MEKRLKITIRGFVQGVGFRYFTLRMADEFGIKGFVKNLYNGDVETEAQGEPGLLNDFVSELKIGPRGSSVTSITAEEIPLVIDDKNFFIK